ncbi:MAG: gamma-butyrobetaine hydroxylase-like domain-containing protein [Pseudomonadota bacterium]
MSEPTCVTDLLYKRGERQLVVTFDDGFIGHISAETLRVESPSAEVQGHGPGQKIQVTGKQMVEITDIAPIGHYAVRITFSDGHQTGLYTWPYLRELSQVRTN